MVRGWSHFLDSSQSTYSQSTTSFPGTHFNKYLISPLIQFHTMNNVIIALGNTLTLTLTLTRLVKKVKDRSMSSSSQPQVCDICPFVLNTCSEHMNSGSLHRPLHAAAAVAESTSSAVDVAETETTDHKRIINPSLTRCYSGLFRSFLHCRTLHRSRGVLQSVVLICIYKFTAQQPNCAS